MATRASSKSAGSRTTLLGLALACAGLLCAMTVGTRAVCAFASPGRSGLRTRVQAAASPTAEAAASAPAPAPSPSPTVALVKVNDENARTTASVLAGFAGALLGGVWLGGALFAASAYYSRKEDDDAAAVLRGVATASLEALNFGASLNEKYTITDKLGSAMSEAMSKQEGSNSVTSFLSGVSDTIKSLDEDIGLKDTFGTLAVSASELAASAVDKALELNEEYQISEKIAAKISEQSKSK